MGLRGRYIQALGSANKDADATTSSNVMRRCALNVEILRVQSSLILKVGGRGPPEGSAVPGTALCSTGPPWREGISIRQRFGSS